MHGITSLESRAILDASTDVRNAHVLVLGVDSRVLHFCQWQRAVLLVNDGQAYVIETVKRRTDHGGLEDVMLRSPSTSFPLPLIIGLMPHVYVPSVAFINARSERAGRVAILRRDKGICTYCGEPGRTVDHIIPKSRGGGSTWQNLVTACHGCNGDKADRTPEEAGMTMLFDPRLTEGGAADLQAEVWRMLNAAAGVVT